MKNHPPRPHRLIPLALLFAAVACVSAGAQLSHARAQTAAHLREKLKLRHSTALVARDVMKSADAGVAEMESQRLQSVLRPMRQASHSPPCSFWSGDSSGGDAGPVSFTRTTGGTPRARR